MALDPPPARTPTPNALVSEKFGVGKASRKRGIVALARRLSILLWRYLEYGVIPEGVRLKEVRMPSMEKLRSCRWQRIKPQGESARTNATETRPVNIGKAGARTRPGWFKTTVLVDGAPLDRQLSQQRKRQKVIRSEWTRIEGGPAKTGSSTDHLRMTAGSPQRQRKFM
ncbi:MAG: hypothetical protein R3F18_17205 [Lysobacterales bacterium]